MKTNMMTALLLIILINFSSSERSQLNFFTLLFWQLIEARLNLRKDGMSWHIYCEVGVFLEGGLRFFGGRTISE